MLTVILLFQKIRPTVITVILLGRVPQKSSGSLSYIVYITLHQVSMPFCTGKASVQRPRGAGHKPLIPMVLVGAVLAGIAYKAMRKHRSVSC